MNTTAMPVFWGINRPGMQAFEEGFRDVLHPRTGELMSHEQAWREAAKDGVKWATAFSEAGYHKQISNRLQENLGHIRAVITATELDNFFELRRHKDAQPEIRHLADKMFEALSKSKPELLRAGEWHLPFVTAQDRVDIWKIVDPEGNAEMVRTDKGRDIADKSLLDEFYALARKVSAARCARTSFRAFHGKISSPAEDIALCDKLAASRPIHASPFEHQAAPDSKVKTKTQVMEDDGWSVPVISMEWRNKGRHRNFVGWIQGRSYAEEEALAS